MVFAMIIVSQLFQSILEEQLSKDDPTEKFEIVSVIGTGSTCSIIDSNLGSYGSVYKCVAKNNKSLCAIKFLHMKAKGNHIGNIVNEINILKESIECPYIVE